MLDIKLDPDHIKKFTLLNINNRLGHDVRDKVMPVCPRQAPHRAVGVTLFSFPLDGPSRRPQRSALRRSSMSQGLSISPSREAAVCGSRLGGSVVSVSGVLAADWCFSATWECRGL